MGAARRRSTGAVGPVPLARRASTEEGSAPSAVTGLQRTAGNRAVTAVLQRDAGGAGASPFHPGTHRSFGSWLQALPSGAVDEKALDITDEVGKELPYLKELVIDLRADCADVTIILKHYYYAFHGRTISIPGRSDGDRKPMTYEIGHGVSKEQLRNVTSNLGTVHFQDMGKLDKLVDYYGGARPFKTLGQVMRAGLKPGDVLVWKKKAGIKGRFSGHIQTVQNVLYISQAESPTQYEIDVLQGTMEQEKAKGQIQSKKLTTELLTGEPFGTGPITFEPGPGEEVFYGAGEWKGGDERP